MINPLMKVLDFKEIQLIMEMTKQKVNVTVKNKRHCE